MTKLRKTMCKFIFRSPWSVYTVRKLKLLLMNSWAIQAKFKIFRYFGLRSDKPWTHHGPNSPKRKSQSQQKKSRTIVCASGFIICKNASNNRQIFRYLHIKNDISLLNFAFITCNAAHTIQMKDRYTIVGHASDSLLYTIDRSFTRSFVAACKWVRKRCREKSQIESVSKDDNNDNRKKKTKKYANLNWNTKIARPLYHIQNRRKRLLNIYYIFTVHNNNTYNSSLKIRFIRGAFISVSAMNGSWNEKASPILHFLLRVFHVQNSRTDPMLCDIIHFDDSKITSNS